MTSPASTASSGGLNRYQCIKNESSVIVLTLASNIIIQIQLNIPNCYVDRLEECFKITLMINTMKIVNRQEGADQ